MAALHQLTAGARQEDLIRSALVVSIVAPPRDQSNSFISVAAAVPPGQPRTATVEHRAFRLSVYQLLKQITENLETKLSDSSY
jgi:hypothetical protein